jgi:prepilin-type N-terminal cleavage/methylation domain-containing protein
MKETWSIQYRLILDLHRGNNMKKNRNGFTLVELIVALSIVTLTLPVVFSLFLVNLQSRTKILILQQVKRNGDDALASIEQLVHTRASAIYSDAALTTEVCSTTSGTSTPTSSSNVYMKDSGGNRFYFYLTNGQIASDSAVISPNPLYLTNNKVAVSNFSISCERTSSFSPPLVSISFQVSQLGTPATREEKATLYYQTKTKLQNYQ